MSLASIQKGISQLNSRERAMLIDLLWESLDEARISEIEQRNPRIESTPSSGVNCPLWTDLLPYRTFVRP